PGAYLRSEDGFGLRPNINVRGVSSERSSRVTLMEDGVLFGPAPYAAPAAYYFPMMTRMTGVDVYMGAATVPYGPTTVGGAINMRGRDIPREARGGLDLGLGSYLSGRVHAWGGLSNDWGGLLAEGVYLRSDGFKTIDGQDDSDTGFDRGELLIRGELRHALGPDVYQRLELRFGLAAEQSNETYLGLTDEDFRADPNRRYLTSQLDDMRWWRTQVQLRHRLEVGEDFHLATVAYRHDIDRSWNKVNALGGLPGDRQPRLDLYDVLNNPTGRNGVLASILRGSRDSEGSAVSNDYLLIGPNARVFGVTGIQSNATGEFETGPLSHTIRGGARLHHDAVDRHHTEDAYAVIGGELRRATEDSYTTLRTHVEALALSAYVSWAVELFDAVTITPGVRAEMIWTRYEDQVTDARSRAFRAAVLPGASVRWAIIDELALFGGVMRGFAPVSPGQAENVRPEDSINWEAGVQFQHTPSRTSAQLTGFITDYQVFLQQCSFASGCADESVDMQTNGGAPIVGGVDARVSTTLAFDDARIPLRAAYTFTYTELRSEVDSGNPQFIGGEPGDHLPYVPEHQVSAQAGIEMPQFGLNVSGSFVSEMWEGVGQGDDPVARTDALFLLDAAAYVQLVDQVRLYVRGENLTYGQSIASRRPFGARPSRPFMIQGGVRVGL
ncbi:MAG: TonB-dependent receptor family protein, partial [Sandaracinaceae bacterium]